MIATVLLALLGAPEIFDLANQHQWSALEQVLAAKKPPVMKAADSALWASARREACKEGQVALAARLGELGARGELACRAYARDWAALSKAIAAMPGFTDALAREEGVTTIATLALADHQEPLVQTLAAKVPRSDCLDFFRSAVAAGSVEAAKHLRTTCTVTVEQLGYALMTSCERQSVEQLRLWKALGVDLAAPRERRTCLHDVSLRGEVAMVKFLLEAGAKPNAVAEYQPLWPSLDEDAVYSSVIGWAVLGGSPEVVKLLLGAGADVSTVTPRLRQQLVFAGPQWPKVSDGLARYPSSPKERETIADLVLGEGRAVLVIGGGATPEAAAESLATWAQVRALADSVLVVPPGFPRIARSDDVPGLKPGFHVVLLAAAKEWQLAPLLPVVNAIRPGSMLRQVTWTPPEGPALLQAKGESELQHSAAIKVKKSTLSVTALFAKGGQTRVVATLFDPNGGFVHGVAHEAMLGDCGAWQCPRVEFKPSATGFEATALGQFVGSCANRTLEVTLRVMLKEEKVVVTEREKVISKEECD